MRLPGLSLAAALVAACAGPATVIGDAAAAERLRALPPAQYAATVALAQILSNRCDIYRYNVPLGDVIETQRAAQGTTLASAQTQVVAVDLEIDVATRNLLARYEVVELTGPDVCAIGAGEVARKSALGALLIRV